MCLNSLDGRHFACIGRRKFPLIKNEELRQGEEKAGYMYLHTQLGMRWVGCEMAAPVGPRAIAPHCGTPRGRSLTDAMRSRQTASCVAASKSRWACFLRMVCEHGSAGAARHCACQATSPGELLASS